MSWSTFWEKMETVWEKMQEPEASANATMDTFDQQMEALKNAPTAINPNIKESGTDFVELKTYEQRLKYLTDPNVPEENKQEVLESVKPEERQKLEKAMEAPKSGLAGAEGDPMDFSLPGGTLSSFTNTDNYKINEQPVAPTVSSPGMKPG